MQNQRKDLEKDYFIRFSFRIVMFKKRGEELFCHIHQEADPHQEVAMVEVEVGVIQDSDPDITGDHIDMYIT